MNKQPKRIPPGDYNIMVRKLRIRYDGKAQLFYEIVDGEFKGMMMKVTIHRKPIASHKKNPK